MRGALLPNPPGAPLPYLINAETVDPNFEPDIQGLYTLSLVVNDGFLDSDPSNVTILAIDAGNLDDFITELMDCRFAA